jgi:hypothetical protein
MVPAVDDRLLADVNGALSENTWLYNGNLRGIPVPKLLRALTNPNAGKVYRIPRSFTDSLHLLNSIWMEFASADTDVLRSQVVDDTFDRYYWVSPLDVPRYFPLSGIVATAPAVTGYMLGIPPPGNISAVVSGGSSSTLKTVSYVQTYVSAYGEEGPPSNPIVLSGIKIDATVTITLHAPDPGDLGLNRNISRSRIYRTVVGTDGTATFFFVAEVIISTTTYADSASDATVALNNEIESTTWTAPPSDLQGFVSLSNGMVAGFRENELWFCEPFRMHAWPAQYTLVTEYPIVGLGVSNQMLVVVTEGYAYTATGITPANISLTKLPGLTPCTSRGSIVSTTDGVYFSTPAGLVLVSPAGVAIATKELIRKDRWNELVATNTLRAAQLGNAYFAFGQARFGVFDIFGFDNTAFTQQDFSGARRGVVIDPTSLSVAFNLLSSSDPIANIFVDAWSAEVFIIRSGQLLWLDIGDSAQTRSPYTWRSKIYQMTEARNLQAMKVYFDPTPTWPISYVQFAQVPALTGASLGNIYVSADTFTVPYYPWMAFAQTDGDAWLSGTGALPHNVYVDLGVPTVISSYDIKAPPPAISVNTAPKTWDFAGSNDGVVFTVLDTQTSAPPFFANELRTYSVPTGNQAAYRFYRFKGILPQSGTQVGLGAFQLYKPALGVIRVYANDRLVMTRELVTSGQQWRMPSGFKAGYWQFEVEAAIEVFSLQAATSPTELQGV